MLKQFCDDVRQFAIQVHRIGFSLNGGVGERECLALSARMLAAVKQAEARMAGEDAAVGTPEDLIEQATGIIMNRFHLDAAQGLEVLRRMSQNTGTQMCVIAEQVINHNVPVKAVRGLEEDVLG